MGLFHAKKGVSMFYGSFMGHRLFICTNTAVFDSLLHRSRGKGFYSIQCCLQSTCAHTVILSVQMVMERAILLAHCGTHGKGLGCLHRW